MDRISGAARHHHGDASRAGRQALKLIVPPLAVFGALAGFALAIDICLAGLVDLIG